MKQATRQKIEASINGLRNALQARARDYVFANGRFEKKPATHRVPPKDGEDKPLDQPWDGVNIPGNRLPCSIRQTPYHGPQGIGVIWDFRALDEDGKEWRKLEATGPHAADFEQDWAPEGAMP